MSFAPARRPPQGGVNTPTGRASASRQPKHSSSQPSTHSRAPDSGQAAAHARGLAQTHQAELHALLARPHAQAGDVERARSVLRESLKRVLFQPDPPLGTTDAEEHGGDASRADTFRRRHLDLSRQRQALAAVRVTAADMLWNDTTYAFFTRLRQALKSQGASSSAIRSPMQGFIQEEWSVWLSLLHQGRRKLRSDASSSSLPREHALNACHAEGLTCSCVLVADGLPSSSADPLAYMELQDSLHLAHVDQGFALLRAAGVIPAGGSSVPQNPGHQQALARILIAAGDLARYAATHHVALSVSSTASTCDNLSPTELAAQLYRAAHLLYPPSGRAWSQLGALAAQNSAGSNKRLHRSHSPPSAADSENKTQDKEVNAEVAQLPGPLSAMVAYYRAQLAHQADSVAKSVAEQNRWALLRRYLPHEVQTGAGKEEVGASIKPLSNSWCSNVMGLHAIIALWLQALEAHIEAQNNTSKRTENAPGNVRSSPVSEYHQALVLQTSRVTNWPIRSFDDEQKQGTNKSKSKSKSKVKGRVDMEGSMKTKGPSVAGLCGRLDSLDLSSPALKSAHSPGLRDEQQVTVSSIGDLIDALLAGISATWIIRSARQRLSAPTACGDLPSLAREEREGLRQAESHVLSHVLILLQNIASQVVVCPALLPALSIGLSWAQAQALYISRAEGHARSQLRRLERHPSSDNVGSAAQAHHTLVQASTACWTTLAKLEASLHVENDRAADTDTILPEDWALLGFLPFMRTASSPPNRSAPANAPAHPTYNCRPSGDTAAQDVASGMWGTHWAPGCLNWADARKERVLRILRNIVRMEGTPVESLDGRTVYVPPRSRSQKEVRPTARGRQLTKEEGSTGPVKDQIAPAHVGMSGHRQEPHLPLSVGTKDSPDEKWASQFAASTTAPATASSAELTPALVATDAASPSAPAASSTSAPGHALSAALDSAAAASMSTLSSAGKDLSVATPAPHTQVRRPEEVEDEDIVNLAMRTAVDEREALPSSPTPFGTERSTVWNGQKLWSNFAEQRAAGRTEPHSPDSSAPQGAAKPAVGAVPGPGWNLRANKTSPHTVGSSRKRSPVGVVGSGANLNSRPGSVTPSSGSLTPRLSTFEARTSFAQGALASKGTSSETTPGSAFQAESAWASGATAVGSNPAQGAGAAMAALPTSVASRPAANAAPSLPDSFGITGQNLNWSSSLHKAVLGDGWPAASSTTPTLSASNTSTDSSRQQLMQHSSRQDGSARPVASFEVPAEATTPGASLACTPRFATDALPARDSSLAAGTPRATTAEHLLRRVLDPKPLLSPQDLSLAPSVSVKSGGNSSTPSPALPSSASTIPSPAAQNPTQLDAGSTGTEAKGTLGGLEPSANALYPPNETSQSTNFKFSQSTDIGGAFQSASDSGTPAAGWGTSAARAPSWPGHPAWTTVSSMLDNGWGATNTSASSFNPQTATSGLGSAALSTLGPNWSQNQGYGLGSGWGPNSSSIQGPGLGWGSSQGQASARIWEQSQKQGHGQGQAWGPGQSLSRGQGQTPGQNQGQAQVQDIGGIHGHSQGPGGTNFESQRQSQNWGPSQPEAQRLQAKTSGPVQGQSQDQTWAQGWDASGQAALWGRIAASMYPSTASSAPSSQPAVASTWPNTNEAGLQNVQRSFQAPPTAEQNTLGTWPAPWMGPAATPMTTSTPSSTWHTPTQTQQARPQPERYRFDPVLGLVPLPPQV